MASPSHEDVVKLNFDGSVVMDRVAAAYVLQNPDGQVIGAGAFNLVGVTISVAEAMGLRERIKLASHEGI